MVASKREKMACQRSMTPKKTEREKRKRGVVISEKKENDTRERTNALRSKPYHHSSIHPHTCTFWSRLHDLFSPWILSLTLQWNASMPCSYPTLSSTKALFAIGKIEGRYCPGEDNKNWVLRENHFGELSRVFENPLQKYLQMDCRFMNKWVLLCEPF